MTRLVLNLTDQQFRALQDLLGGAIEDAEIGLEECGPGDDQQPFYDVLSLMSVRDKLDLMIIDLAARQR